MLKDVFKDNFQNLDSSQKQKFSQLLVNFQDIFEDDDVSGKCKLVEHKIELIDPRPIKQPIRPLPLHLQTEINQIINDMQKQGVIEVSSSSWCSPVVLKQKKDGTREILHRFPKIK